MKKTEEPGVSEDGNGCRYTVAALERRLENRTNQLAQCVSSNVPASITNKSLRMVEKTSQLLNAAKASGDGTVYCSHKEWEDSVNADPNSPVPLWAPGNFEQTVARTVRPGSMADQIATLRAEVRMWKTVAVICGIVAVIAVYAMMLAMNGLIR